jgi:hypothetical protein
VSEKEAGDIPYEKEVPAGAPDEDELDLIEEDEEGLEPDSSPEATKEAAMSGGGAELTEEGVEFEEDESGVAR